MAQQYYYQLIDEKRFLQNNYGRTTFNKKDMPFCDQRLFHIIINNKGAS